MDYWSPIANFFTAALNYQAPLIIMLFVILFMHLSTIHRNKHDAVIFKEYNEDRQTIKTELKEVYELKVQFLSEQLHEKNEWADLRFLLTTR